MSSNLYQTLEDRSNIDYVEENGPFICRRSSAWLGIGYYYWDTFVDNAHLWGEKIYKKNNKDYIICLSRVVFNSSDVYNLEDSNTLFEFKVLEQKLSDVYPDKNITVAVVLAQLKQSQDFVYKAIKARALDDMSSSKQKIPFMKNHKAYLDTCPHIKVCIIDKTFIGESNFKVIYPSVYCDDYTI